MCEPWTIASAVLAIGSTAANSAAQARVVRARNNALRAERIRVRLGATSHMDEAHFREHWDEATRGTDLADVEVAVELSPEPFGVMLVDVDLEA